MFREMLARHDQFTDSDGITASLADDLARLVAA